MFKKIQVRKFLEEVCGAEVRWCFDNLIKVNDHVVILDENKFILKSDSHYYGTKRNLLKTLKKYGFTYKNKLQLNYH